MNRIVLMGSDYFIVPASPDFFCYQAIQSLATMIPEWYLQTANFREKDVINYLPQVPPKFLGVITQKYNKYAKKMAKSYEQWADKIENATADVLAKKLLDVDPPLCIPEKIFRQANPENNPYTIVNVPDFNSLIAISQEESIPVFEIDENILRNHKKAGAAKEGMYNNAKEFNDLFKKLANCICVMTDTTLPASFHVVARMGVQVKSSIS